MRLLLARHGETGDQYVGRYIGATDLPLSANGRAQARRLRELLPVGIGRCLCSPMLRARQTAELALGGAACQIEILDPLREVDFGRWEGLSFAEIAAQDEGLVADWQRDALAFQFPGGEHTASFWRRVQAVIEVITKLPEEEVLVVCHGGVIRAMICALLGLSFEHYLLFAVQPAALTVFDVDGQRGVLLGLNL